MPTFSVDNPSIDREYVRGPVAQRQEGHAGDVVREPQRVGNDTQRRAEEILRRGACVRASTYSTHMSHTSNSEYTHITHSSHTSQTRRSLVMHTRRTNLRHRKTTVTNSVIMRNPGIYADRIGT